MKNIQNKFSIINNIKNNNIAQYNAFNNAAKYEQAEEYNGSLT
jgi:hypothetical protein